jgi:uncharacterized protein with beta-barrel porin domain
MARRPGRQARAPSFNLCAQPAQRASCARSLPAYHAVYNYAGDAGRGSQNFNTSETWRAALLGTVAAGAVFLGNSRSARANCYGPSPTLTCTGVIAGTAAPGVANGGIDVPAGYTTLNVNNIDADIAPDTDVNGINFSSTGSITITSGTSPYRIVTTGNANGIDAYSPGGAVSIQHTGDIAGTGGAGDTVYGIKARSRDPSGNAGAVTVTSSADIAVTTAGIGIGIDAQATSGTGGFAGIVDLSSTGEVVVSSSTAYGALSNARATGLNARQLAAVNAAGVDLTSAGNVTVGAAASGYASSASSLGVATWTYSGTGNDVVATLSSTGDVEATATATGHNSGSTAVGLSGYSGGNSGSLAVNSLGNIATLSSGDVSAASLGIVASTTSEFYAAGNVTVTSNGNVTANADKGNTLGVVQSYGIAAGSNAIYGNSAGAVSITSTGDVSARAVSAGGADIIVRAEAFSATSQGYQADSSSVSVNSTGNLTATASSTSVASAFGVHAQSKSDMGNAGDVTVESIGDITASATGAPYSGRAYGIQARSYSADGNAGTVMVESAGAITATTLGIDARSTSYAGSAGNITVNSTGNLSARTGIDVESFASADSGVVEITSVGDIGDGETGIFADTISIYGNAGSVTVNSTGNISSNFRAIAAYASSNNGTAGSANVTSTGDLAGGISARSETQFDDAGNVTVTNVGNINALYTTGILALSNASFAGNSGNVLVKNTGDTTTQGNTAIWAQTRGRDGAGSATVINEGNITINGTGDGIIGSATGDAGSPGNVSITSIGNISTLGRGIVAGVSTASGGTPGEITVTTTGNIAATGNGFLNAAIWVLSGTFTPSTRGNTTVDILGGNITGGSGTGAGVRFQYGANNQLTNFGSISALSGLAIVGDLGNETVDNYSTVTGNVDLGTGANAFFNRDGGLFNSGTTVVVGAGNTLTNAGTLAPLGKGTIGVTNLTGNLVQDAGGVFAIDVDMAGNDADAIDMHSTGIASMDGGVALNFFGLSPVSRSFTILNDATNIPVQGLTLLNPAVLAAITYPGNTDVLLTITGYDFSASGLNANETSVGDNLNAAFNAGGGGLEPIFTNLANLTSLPALAGALDQLSPEIYGDTQLAALYASLDFSSNLLSCKMNGADTAAINREGQCLWVSGKARFLDNDQSFQNIGFEETAGLFAAGAQLALDPVWRLGFGLGYQTSELETATHAQSDGDMLQGGVALKYNPGALELAGVVSGGRAWYDTERPVAFGNVSATAVGDHAIDILSGRLHASYVLGAPSLYFKPMADATVTQLDLGDFSETGAGAAGLIVNGSNTTVFSVSPALEIGTEWWWSNGTLVRPFLRGGVTWFSDDDVTVTASFAGSPTGVSPFTIASQVDQVQADLAAGVEMINGEDSALRLTYDGQLGNTTQIHAFALKGSAKF